MAVLVIAALMPAVLVPPVVTAGAAWPAVLLAGALRPALLGVVPVDTVGAAMLGFDISGELACVLVASGVAAPLPLQARTEASQTRRIRCAQFMKAAVVSNRPPLHDEIATQKRFHPLAARLCALFTR
ncbi:MAG TPA: hypothetical protein VFN67_42155 [Polyangiales bacterium]|nr:hypothetical protein [Polyangiales bacterium]